MARPVMCGAVCTYARAYGYKHKAGNQGKAGRECYAGEECYILGFGVVGNGEARCTARWGNREQRLLDITNPIGPIMKKGIGIASMLANPSASQGHSRRFRG